MEVELDWQAKALSKLRESVDFSGSFICQCCIKF
jgi:hypothetical protein